MIIILNTIGLGLDILGVCLLFKFGFPQPSFQETTTLAINVPTSDEVRRNARSKRQLYKIMSFLALSCLIIGFAFQIAAQWIKPSHEIENTIPIKPENIKYNKSTTETLNTFTRESVNESNSTIESKPTPYTLPNPEQTNKALNSYKNEEISLKNESSTSKARTKRNTHRRAGRR